MKKTLFFTLLTVASIFYSEAQVAYNFSVSNAPYTNLTGGNGLFDPNDQDFFGDTIIAIGFPFNFFGTLYDSIYIDMGYPEIVFAKQGYNEPFIVDLALMLMKMILERLM